MRVDDRPCEPSECESAAMFPGVGKAVGAASFYALTPTEKFQAHRHVLVNSLTVEKFIDDFRAITKRQLRSRTRSQSHIDNVVHREFPEWFNREVKPVMINPVIDGILFVLSQTDETCDCYLPGIGAIRKKVPQEIRLCVHNKYRQEAVAPHTGGDEGLFQENVRETPEETGEIVQDSMEEDDVVKDDSSKEVVSTVNNAPKLTFDLNKIPEENGVF
ncbi:hypothetical protein Ahy_B06g083229 [Arachis hypogaea]|uniref:Uncharacterized protein n=1 Tax=Arachis hypogaea TaxID=3818 RepID=A0A444YPG7_ARAHY|nr:hypothetical protein Ahy_B06g083229 [Arachis hypogaea]